MAPRGGRPVPPKRSAGIGSLSSGRLGKGTYGTALNAPGPEGFPPGAAEARLPRRNIGVPGVFERDSRKR